MLEDALFEIMSIPFLSSFWKTGSMSTLRYLEQFHQVFPVISMQDLALCGLAAYFQKQTVLKNKQQSRCGFAAE
jgi:hypothetical protein